MRWYLTVNESGRHIQDAEINEDNYICNVESSDKHAKLIAAAPDLLAACRYALDAVEDSELYPQDATDRLVAAIARAG